MKSLAGQFLVAAPQLGDPNFTQTVVLMLQHESEGALGVVINRPGTKTVADVWKMIGADPCACLDLVFVGGPVPGPLIALHTSPEAAEREVLPGLYMAMQRDAIDALVRDPEAQFRLFSGHAGWAGGQLEGELRVGGWLTTRASVEEVFGPYEDLWKSVCGRIGREIIAPHLPPACIPEDPSLN
jgi:putative transcriptional regulator